MVHAVEILSDYTCRSYINFKILFFIIFDYVCACVGDGQYVHKNAGIF